MIFVNKDRKQFSQRQVKSLDTGQRERLHEHKKRQGLIVNPELKGKTIGMIINGKYVNVEADNAK